MNLNLYVSLCNITLEIYFHSISRVTLCTDAYGFQNFIFFQIQIWDQKGKNHDDCLFGKIRILQTNRVTNLTKSFFIFFHVKVPLGETRGLAATAPILIFRSSKLHHSICTKILVIQLAHIPPSARHTARLSIHTRISTSSNCIALLLDSLTSLELLLILI